MEDDGAQQMTLESLPDPYPLVQSQRDDVAWRARYRHQAIVVCLKVVETSA
jgi:hypothetical protein